MADEAAPEQTQDGEEASKEKKGGAPILMIIILVLLLGIIGGGVFLFFTEGGRAIIGLGVPHEEEEKKKIVRKLPEDITYYELPEMLINVHSDKDTRKPYLRLSIKLELHDPETVATLDLIKPRIIDSFQVYLRELRVTDLEGSAGSQRLKEELLKRVNAVAAPAIVDDVLFQTFVVQ